VSGSRRRAAVLGSPIRHSLSPVLHRAAYAALGLDWEYDAVECDADGLLATLERLAPTHVGVSLTMPLKQAVLPLLAHVDELAGAVGAVNTVLLEPGGWRGSNTDVPGLVAALQRAGLAATGPVVVLGGGATAASAVASLASLGHDEPLVVVRDPDRAAGLLAAAARIGAWPRVHRWAEWDGVVEGLVVSTVPAGAADPLAATVAWLPGSALFDVVYAPWPTPLAQAAAAAGAAVVGGLELLVEQAALQVEAMTGQPAPVEAMRTAGERALSAGG
jgi:shikimate dehydrogenase